MRDEQSRIDKENVMMGSRLMTIHSVYQGRSYSRPSSANYSLCKFKSRPLSAATTTKVRTHVSNICDYEDLGNAENLDKLIEKHDNHKKQSKKR